MDNHDRRALEELPELYRRALILVDAGISPDAIAQELDVAVPAVMALLEIGRAKLANQQQRSHRSSGSTNERACGSSGSSGRSKATAGQPPRSWSDETP
jgi:orotate phosphoribosyltransferase-like protein